MTNESTQRDESKPRTSSVANQRAVTPQAFVVEALEAEAQMMETGQGFDADDVHAWLRARASGWAACKPQLTPWRH